MRAIVPACELPRKVIAAMVAAGAQKEEVEDEDLRVIRVDGVDSDAWKEYKYWVLSLGEVDPLVMPPRHLRSTPVCPLTAMVGDVQDEANSIVNHFAPLRMNAFAVGIPAILAPLAPIVGPAAPVNVHRASVAVQAISSPGAGFPVINALHQGQYVCHVHYQWRGAVITVPIFRLG